MSPVQSPVQSPESRVHVLHQPLTEEVGHDHVRTKSGRVAPYNNTIKPKTQSKALAAVLDEKVC